MQNCNLPAHTSAKHNPPPDVHPAKASIRLNVKYKLAPVFAVKVSRPYFSTSPQGAREKFGLGTRLVRHVNSAVRSGDSYKTENADDGKAKSRDTRATNCEAGTRERPANLFILALPCRCRHASLGFTYVSFSRRLLHTNPFSHFPT